MRCAVAFSLRDHTREQLLEYKGALQIFKGPIQTNEILNLQGRERAQREHRSPICTVELAHVSGGPHVFIYIYIFSILRTLQHRSVHGLMPFTQPANLQVLHPTSKPPIPSNWGMASTGGRSCRLDRMMGIACVPHHQITDRQSLFPSLLW